MTRNNIFNGETYDAQNEDVLEMVAGYLTSPDDGTIRVNGKRSAFRFEIQLPSGEFVVEV